ncbi:MAG TPA: type VI secretion system tip protein TssI/VgrG, partial [Nannocystis sp.]
DENSSCWVRCSTAWAGRGYGQFSVPRIGQEVLVDFLEGDPDRPVVVGRIYHGDNPPPYPLPDHKTRSTIKSESSPGGGGFNELRFEDRKGQEEVFLHAEKDWNTVILHDLTESVGVNRSSSIGVNESVVVGTNRSVMVGSNNSTIVGNAHSVTIKQPPPPRIGPPPPPIPPTGTTMSDKFFSLTSGLATVSVNGADVTIDATGTVTIHSVGNLSVRSDADLFLLGQNIIMAAAATMTIGGVDVTVNGTTLALGGKAKAELTSSGPTTVSGTPVQLNGPGLFAGRVTELAPAAITTGAALVLVGGASFPLPVVKLPDGTLQIGQNITVSPGTGRYEDFQNKVLRDLGIMSSTPAGAQRLANIENDPGKHNINIREYSAAEEAEYGANNSLAAATGDGAGLTYDKDGNPVPGSGSGSVISYNPDAVSGPAGHPKPADSRLFHEMGHAEHNSMGIRRDDPMTGGWTDGEEYQTIQGGVNQPGGTMVPGKPTSPSENQYLEQRNYPYRRTGHGKWGNPDGSPIVP